MATVIHVGGVSRSGSTMLHLILGNAPNAFACGEAVNWYRPAKSHHFAVECACAQDPCPVWATIKDVPPQAFYATALRQLQVDFLIDSSKEVSWLIDARRWTAAHGLRAINLFVWKDPVDLAYSFWKREQDIMFWRSQFVTYYRRVLAVDLPLLAVNFSDLTQSPQTKVAEVCAAVGMPYFPGKERFWEKEHHHLFGSLGIRRQVEAGDSFIQATKSFPPEFAQQLDDLRQRIATDREVQALMAVLHQADVSRLALNGSWPQQFTRKPPYPLWYYKQRAKRLWHSYFPRQHHLAKREKVATIPRQQEQ
jgi:hypothetical protein